MEEIKGLLSICFNPLVSLPNSNYVREALEKLEYYVCIDFFLNETARHADIILAGSLQEEEEGTTTSAEGRVIRIRQAVTPPGDARTDTSIILELAERLGAKINSLMKIVKQYLMNYVLLLKEVQQIIME